MQRHLQRLTKSALLSLILITSLSGCASFNPFGKAEKPIEVRTKAEERTRLNLPPLEPLQLNPPTWVVIHPENAPEVWKQIAENGDDVVLFGLTDDNYQKLAMMIGELRNFINAQRLIIEQYKKYYEPETEK
jgi:hypothetical protein